MENALGASDSIWRKRGDVSKTTWSTWAPTSPRPPRPSTRSRPHLRSLSSTPTRVQTRTRSGPAHRPSNSRICMEPAPLRTRLHLRHPPWTTSTVFPSWTRTTRAVTGGVTGRVDLASSPAHPLCSCLCLCRYLSLAPSTIPTVPIRALSRPAADLSWRRRQGPAASSCRDICRSRRAWTRSFRRPRRQCLAHTWAPFAGDGFRSLHRARQVAGGGRETNFTGMSFGVGESWKRGD